MQKKVRSAPEEICNTGGFFEEHSSVDADDGKVFLADLEVRMCLSRAIHFSLLRVLWSPSWKALCEQKIAFFFLHTPQLRGAPQFSLD